ncbi:MAG: plasmid pRiA4b ORF-3 family protein [Planctomycetes bacterium]|nr:plasmid pRiA4b ORF-3 family protein [Planctomycetota bacterium]
MSKGDKCVYELEVSLIGGPVSDKFVEKNPSVLRTIQIRGDQKLSVLHEAIFDAFGRDDEHLYEFQVGGKGPMDNKARRYVMPLDEELGEDPGSAGLAARTTIDGLGLKKGQKFFYWFDFGDDWWHEIEVTAILEGHGAGKYPRVTAKTGDNPPQYPDWDDDEDNDKDEQE